MILKSENHVKTNFYTRKSLNFNREKTVLYLLKVQNSCVCNMSYSKGHQLNTSHTLRQISTIACRLQPYKVNFISDQNISF